MLTVVDHGAPIWILLRDRQTDVKLGSPIYSFNLACLSSSLLYLGLAGSDSLAGSDGLGLAGPDNFLFLWLFLILI